MASIAGVRRARFSARLVSAIGAAMANVERRVRRVRAWVLGKSMLAGMWWLVGDMCLDEELKG